MSKKKKINIAKAMNYQHLPTRERMSYGDIAIRNNIAMVDDPLRIDKLLANGVIDEMQHLYGLQIITLRTCACRPFLRAVQYEPRTGRRLPSFEALNLSRMSAEDQYHKTMSHLKGRDHELITKICFEEMAAIEAGKALGLPINSITSYLRNAFDALGNALAAMRDVKKAMEKSAEAKKEYGPTPY